MPKSRTIRGLERGLAVLRVLQDTPIASLHAIHEATQIPKPSLLRILQTLEAAGVVTRRLADGKFRLSAFGSVPRKVDRHDLVAEAAAPVLHRLCEKVRWPSDLFVPAGGYLDRRETSRRHSPFLLPPVEANRIGHRVGYLMTAVGRAYLAWCPESELQRILARLRKQNRPADFLAHDPQKLKRVLTLTRQRGYATRDSSFTGGSLGTPIDDGMAAIAVPLFDGSRNHGAINILWIRNAFTVEAFAARHLADLQHAAQDIVASLKSRADA